MNSTDAPGANEEEYIRLSLNFSRTLLLKIDHIRQEWGLKSRSAVIERLLEELFSEDLIEESSDSEGQKSSQNENR